MSSVFWYHIDVTKSIELEYTLTQYIDFVGNHPSSTASRLNYDR